MQNKIKYVLTAIKPNYLDPELNNIHTSELLKFNFGRFAG